MSKKHMGSGIDDFLKEEGIFRETQAQAIKEVVAWQLAQAMKNWIALVVPKCYSTTVALRRTRGGSMKSLRTAWKDPRHRMFLAAVAAAYFLFFGGANALGQVTVRCVPSHTLNSSCTGTDYATIQKAVTAAGAGDIVLVGPGTYHESVAIIDETGHSRDGLALLGAQAGKDARLGRLEPQNESIVDGSRQPAGSTITVEALNVIIDGFTVQGATADEGTASGIDLKGFCKGLFSPANRAKVVNNIVEQNANGISLNQEACGAPGSSYPPSSGGALLTGVRVLHNFIRDNNSASLGYGNGINSGGVDLTLVSENAFERNLNIAIRMSNSSHVSVIENTSKKDGIFALFYNSSSSKFSNNQGEEFAAEGPPVSSGPLGAVTIAASTGIVISDNRLEKGNPPIDDGIELGSYGVGIPSSQYLDVLSNHIKRFPANGIYADLDAFLDSYIVGNTAENNGSDGIFIFGAGNTNNSFFDNVAVDNAKYDCEDDTTGGPGTAGTWNRWLRNTGDVSIPSGICAPDKGSGPD